MLQIKRFHALLPSAQAVDGKRDQYMFCLEAFEQSQGN